MKGFIEVTYFRTMGISGEDETLRTKMIPVNKIKGIVRVSYNKRYLNSYGFYDEPECYIQEEDIIYPQESYEEIKQLIKEAQA